MPNGHSPNNTPISCTGSVDVPQGLSSPVIRTPNIADSVGNPRELPSPPNHTLINADTPRDLQSLSPSPSGSVSSPSPSPDGANDGEDWTLDQKLDNTTVAAEERSRDRKSGESKPDCSPSALPCLAEKVKLEPMEEDDRQAMPEEESLVKSEPEDMNCPAALMPSGGSPLNLRTVEPQLDPGTGYFEDESETDDMEYLSRSPSPPLAYISEECHHSTSSMLAVFFISLFRVLSLAHFMT